MLYSRILAAGRALPARYVTNDELAAELARDGIETSDEWIRTRTGIEGRYIAEEGLTTLELARRASVEALQRAGIAADTVDLIVVATTTPDSLRLPVGSRPRWAQRAVRRLTCRPCARGLFMP